ncbi:hypothetical protein imdm_945 [gamma proteobacterium IMCC2047]|nr:hypothetical protein imdm_945 [gamma proteobacterium IMCC2047]
MRYLKFGILALAVLMSSWVKAQSAEQNAELAECVEPDMMLLPEGSKASSDEMLAAQVAVNRYISDTKNFLSCLLAYEKTIGDALTYEQKKSSITRYNLAVARMERLVESYNKQLRTYQQSHNEAG